MMKCEFEYCIYNENCLCGLGSAEINPFGMCGACIILSLGRDFLEVEKRRQLETLEDR